MKTYDHQRAKLWEAINEIDEAKRTEMLIKVATEAQTHGLQWEEAFARVMANYMPICIAAYVGWGLAVVFALLYFL